MKKAHLAWFLGSALLVAGGSVMMACSSDSGTGTPSTGGGNDSGTHSDGSSGGNDSGGGGQDSGGGGNDGGMTADCGSIPTLHTDDAGDIYCGFQNDAGLICPTGQECCLGGKMGSSFAPQQCSAFGSACTNGTDGGIQIQCAQNSDCTANGKMGNVCCLQGTQPLAVPGCGYSKATGGTGIVCEAPTNGGCAANETQVCSTTNDCPMGKTCVPMKWKILQLGFCQ